MPSVLGPGQAPGKEERAAGTEEAQGTPRGAWCCPPGPGASTDTTCAQPASWTLVPHPLPQNLPVAWTEAELAPQGCLRPGQRVGRAGQSHHLKGGAFPAPPAPPVLTRGLPAAPRLSHLAPSGGGSGSGRPSSCPGPGLPAAPPRSSARGPSAAGPCTGPGGLSGGPVEGTPGPDALGTSPRQRVPAPKPSLHLTGNDH